MDHPDLIAVIQAGDLEEHDHERQGNEGERAVSGGSDGQG